MPGRLRVGDLVWAKMKGFPPWPARVIPPDPDVKQPKKSKDSLYVFFFGTEDHAWIEVPSLFPYDEYFEKYHKNKTHTFKEALAKVDEYRETMPPRENDDDDDEDEVDSSIFFGRDDKGKFFSSTDEYEFIDNEGKSPNLSLNDVRPKKRGKKRGVSGGSTDSCVSIGADDESESAPKSKKKRKKKKLQNGGNSSSQMASMIESTVQTYEVFDNDTTGVAEDDEEEEEDDLDISVSSYATPTKTPISMEHVHKYKIGIIGIGAIGTGVAGNLLATGYEIFMWNRTQSKTKMLKARGAMDCASPGDVVRSADMIFVCVADDRAVRDVLHGKHGMKGSIDRKKSIINLSTVDADTALAFNKVVKDRGARYLEAPVWGSKAAAEGGTLIVLTSGDKTLFNDAEPCFQMIGKNIQYLGDDIQRACKLKLILNMITGITVCGLAEGLSLANKLGFDIHQVVNILDLGALSCPLLRTKGNAIAENSFPVGLSLKNQQKDMNLALNLAETAKAQGIFISLSNEMYKKAVRMGYSSEDMCAVYKAML